MNVSFDDTTVVLSYTLRCCMLVAVPLNVLLLLTIYRTWSSINASVNILIIQLAVCDTVLGAITSFVFIRNAIYRGWDGFDSVTVLFQASVSMCACYASIMTLMIIAIKRYLLIMKEIKLSYLTTLCCAVVTLLLSLICAFSHYWGGAEYMIEPSGLMAGYIWYHHDGNLIPSVIAVMRMRFLGKLTVATVTMLYSDYA
jgi:hypothetical protein